MPHIPNTSLSLTEAEIQAVMNYVHDRKLGIIIDEEEFEMPNRFKNIINTRRTKKAHKDSPLILPPHQGYYRAEDEL